MTEDGIEYAQRAVRSLVEGHHLDEDDARRMLSRQLVALGAASIDADAVATAFDAVLGSLVSEADEVL